MSVQNKFREQSGQEDNQVLDLFDLYSSCTMTVKWMEVKRESDVLTIKPPYYT